MMENQGEGGRERASGTDEEGKGGKKRGGSA